MFNKSTRRRRHNSSSSSNNSQQPIVTQKIAIQNNSMSSSGDYDEPTMSLVIVCAILYVLSGVTQVSYIIRCIHLYSMYKSAHLMRRSHSLL